MEPSDGIVVIDDIESGLFLLVSSRSSLNMERFFRRKSNLLIFSPPKLVRLSLTVFFDAENNRSITVFDAGIAKTCFGVFRSWNRTPREIFLGVGGGVGGEHPFLQGIGAGAGVRKRKISGPESVFGGKKVATAGL